jgi:UDP-3-O-[3-hydroxymyristoyl] N-acetylglucosamine deacetylase
VQTTLKSAVSFAGIGLHGGQPVSISVLPAEAGQGIVFRRTDVLSDDPIVPARWDRVSVSPLKTQIANGDGVSVSTIEHLMAALAGTGVHNATVLIDGPEVPVMDGSALEFARGLIAAGRQQVSDTLIALRILETVEVSDGAASARLSPSSGFQIEFSIEFPDRAIGRQYRLVDLANGNFLHELASCRTFCRLSDVEEMHASGLALGGTLDNAVVFDDDRVLTRGGLRFADEAVRHKMLDVLGDLATAGIPIIGRYTGIRAGHAVTNRLLRKLFATPRAFRLVQADRALMERLPGAGVASADLDAVA